MRFKKYLICLLFIPFSQTLPARERDSGTWMDLSVIKEFRKVELAFKGEFYTKEHNHSVERTSVGLDSDYQFLPWLSLGSGYLLMNFNRTGYQEVCDRFFFQMEPSWKMGGLLFSLREKYQVTRSRRDEIAVPVTSYFRSRCEVIFQRTGKRVEPMASIESLYRVKREEPNRIDEFRFLLGANYSISRRHFLTFYGLLAAGSAQNRFILGIGYDFKL